MTYSDHVKVNSVNPLHIIVDETDRYIEEINGNKYLIFTSTDEIKGVLKNYPELWNKSKDLIKKLNDKSGEYRKDFIKIKLNLDDNLPLNKILKLHNLTIVVRSVF